MKELVGPYTLLRSGPINVDAGLITIPLYHGTMENDPSYNVWYVIIDSTDQANAAALGINFSAKLAYANYGRATRVARFGAKAQLVFRNGKVDFSPVRSIVPGAAPNYFPPTSFQPGSMGDTDYSPLVRIRTTMDHVYNAPIVAANWTASEFNPSWCTTDIRTLNAADQAKARSVLHDKVVKFCPPTDYSGVGTVTLQLTAGFSFGKAVFYLSMEASAGLPAAFEGVTEAPGMNDLTIGRDDSVFSPVERLFAVTNGHTNGDINSAGLTGGPANETSHPHRQGFNSALRDNTSPLNILGGIPTVATDYSPMWDLNIGSWTDYAIKNGYRARINGEFDYLGFVQRGYITAPGGGPFGSSGLIVNCPIVHRFL